MIELQICVPENITINQEMIRFGVQRTLELSNNSEADMTIRFTDDNEMRQLNKSYRDIARPTDVLSFNQNTIDPETQRMYLGDIIISSERAQEQAAQHNQSFDEECTLLAIHGTLHLLGYDHYKKEEKEIMWRFQKAILFETINAQVDTHEK
jgi:probable rRNA maturation factor